jgi:hypothetical protein
MVTFTTVFLAATAFTGALNIPGGNSMRRASIGSSTGTNNGCVCAPCDARRGMLIAMQIVRPVLVERCQHCPRQQRRQSHRWQGAEPQLDVAVSIMVTILLHDTQMFLSTNHFSGSYNPGSSGGSLALYDWSENPLVNYYGTNGGGGWSKNPLASSYGTNGGGGWSKNPLANSYGTNGGGGWSKTPLVEYYGTTRGGGWSRW